MTFLLILAVLSNGFCLWCLWDDRRKEALRTHVNLAQARRIRNAHKPLRSRG